ncbi:MAG: ribonuclease R family protein [Acidobacteriota bacterium]
MDWVTLLGCLRRSKAPATIPFLERVLDLNAGTTVRLRAQLEYLGELGVLFAQRRGRWAIHTRFRFVIGRLVSSHRRFGFVRPEGGAGRDVYVAYRDLRDAQDGDLVMVRVYPAGREAGGRGPQGEVLAVLGRRPARQLGVLHRTGQTCMLEPRDQRLGRLVPVAGSCADTPDGSLVWTDIERDSLSRLPVRGRVREVLGPLDDPAVQEAMLRRLYDLPDSFGDELLREATAHGRSLRREDRAGRIDYRDQGCVTIDPDDARDHDDAVHVERLREPVSGYRLTVHIADVSHYVRQGSALDEEGRRRGLSVYLPGRSIPMLPVSLSGWLCSLVPGEDRVSQSVTMEFDETGRRLSARLTDGLMRSRARLTYEEVAVVLAGRPGQVDPEVAAMLGVMRELSVLLRVRRKRRGCIDLDIPEVQVLVDADGRPVRVRSERRTAAHEIIEESMLAANEVVAAFLSVEAHPGLYRVHEEPDPDAIELLEGQLMDWGLPIQRRRGSAATRLRAILSFAHGRPEETAAVTRALRSLKLALYSHEPSPHFALAARVYTHFTSPIRRYPDLVVHRLVKRIRHGRPGDEDMDRETERLARIALDCSHLERQAEAAERTMTSLKTALYMKDRVGEEFHGRVTGILAEGWLVTLDDLGCEGLIPGTFRPVRGNRRRAGRRPPRTPGPRIRPGEVLRVRVRQVDLLRGRILLRPVSCG